MNIFGKKTLLRAIEASDLAVLQEMINDPEIEYSVGGWGFPVSASEQAKWYENSLLNNQTKRFMIETLDKSTNSAIGMIYITDIDWKNRSVSTGIKLAKNAPHREGYATDALKALLSFLFDELQMNRVSLKILANNEASIKLYEKCGAKKEGILREAVFKKGQYIDQLCYGIIKSDFKAVK